MRLFAALDIQEEIRGKIAVFMEQMRKPAPGPRWVSAESLHVTLKFIGEASDMKLKDIETVLRTISSEPFQISFRGCGFFPTPKSARVFWVGIDAEAGLAKLARAIEGELVQVGVPEEKREFSPHLTLARAGDGSGAPGWRKGDKANRQFAALQARLSEIPTPDFGTMTAREFFLYRSQLSPKGSRYAKIAHFPLAVREP